MLWKRLIGSLIRIVLMLCLVGISSACDDPFERGKAEGRTEGYRQGFKDGRQQSFAAARSQGEQIGYENGKRAGLTEGDAVGYQRGTKEGTEKGHTEGYALGLKKGHQEGLAEGLKRGREAGRSEGKAAAFAQGQREGEAKGRIEGETTGIQKGKLEGYKEGYETGERDGRRKATLDKAKILSWKIGLPIVMASLVLGLLLNLLGWRSLSSLSGLMSSLAKELEIRKDTAREKMASFAEERRNLRLSAPDVWFVVISLVGFATSEYFVRRELTIFLIALVFCLLGTLYAVRSSFTLLARFCLFWLAAAAITIDIYYADAAAWLREPAAITIVLMTVYFLARGLFGADWNRPTLDGSAGNWETGFVVVAMIGVTLQILWIVTVMTNLFAPSLLTSSMVGRRFAEILVTIRSLSPASWMPAGISGLALLIASALRMSRRRFVPTLYEELPPHLNNPAMGTLLILIKLPFWLLFNVFRFLAHYVEQVGRTLKGFASNYIARFVYLTMALAFPLVCILQGHALIQHSAATIERHLLSAQAIPALHLGIVVISLITATVLYLLSIATLPIEIEQTPILKLPTRLAAVIRFNGAPPVFVAGVSYAIFFALLIVSTPIVCLIPGAEPAGFFVWLCSVILGGVIVAGAVSWFRSARAERVAHEERT